MFNLYNPDEKLIARIAPGEKNFPDALDYDEEQVILDFGMISRNDKTLTLRVYKSEERAAEVCDMIVNAFRSGKSEFILPKE